MAIEGADPPSYRDASADEIDDDNHSTVSSDDLVELDADEFPRYFEERRGRLFHSHGSSPYPLPVDAGEQHRQNDLHTVSRRLLRGIYIGPVHEVLTPTGINGQRKVVDFGTGTGKWVLDMAREFRDVKFYGLDIVPIASRSPPANAQFELQDLREGTRFPDESIDIVHARSIEMISLDYSRLLQEAARILRPGGLYLACEWVFKPVRRDGRPLGECATTTFFSAIARNVYQPRGLRFIANEILLLIGQTELFRDIRGNLYSVPVANIPYEVFEYYAKTMAFLLMEGGMSRGEVDRLASGYLAEMNAMPDLVIKYYVAHARKA